MTSQVFFEERKKLRREWSCVMCDSAESINNKLLCFFFLWKILTNTMQTQIIAVFQKLRNS
jgi:hypothetical protein